jgi:hypothetical protein
VIQTLAITVITEGLLCLVYALGRKKPVRPILLTSIVGNLLTQSLLWLSLSIFFQHYLVTLLIAETVIWLIESLLLYVLRFNQLDVGESLLLSLMMNLSSFGSGWMLPI